MRVLAICQDELLIRSLDAVLLPSFEVDFLVDSRPLARRLHDAGMQVITGDPRRVDTYLKADISPSTCFIVEDNGRRSVKKIVSAIRDAGGTLIYLLHTGARGGKTARRESRAALPDVTHLELAELIRPTLVTELSRSMTRARVQQYQRYFADADRVLILLHNDPGPGRAGQRPRAAQPAAPHQDHGDHRRHAGRDPAREPAHGQHARHPRRARSPRHRCRSSSGSRRWTCSRTTSAGC